MSTDAWFYEFERDEAHRMEAREYAATRLRAFHTKIAREWIERAANCLFRSMEADGSLMRNDWIIQAQSALAYAAVSNTPHRDAILAHMAAAMRGNDIQALHDELRALAKTMRGEE